MLPPTPRAIQVFSRPVNNYRQRRLENICGTPLQQRSGIFATVHRCALFVVLPERSASYFWLYHSKIQEDVTAQQGEMRRCFPFFVQCMFKGMTPTVDGN